MIFSSHESWFVPLRIPIKVRIEINIKGGKMLFAIGIWTLTNYVQNQKENQNRKFGYSQEPKSSILIHFVFKVIK